MKIITLLFSALFFVSVTNAQKKPVVINQNFQRSEKVINSQWTFNYFPSESADKGYEMVRVDDSKWPAVSLPHTWNTYETTGELHPFIRNASESENMYWWIGWGWYRKHFTLSRDLTNKKIFLEFEGVQKYCKVWLNGKLLGDHKGGYGSFDFDITLVVKPGEDNVLAVAVNNQQNDQFKIPPMAARSFNVYGGIFRDVRIAVRNKLYIPMQGSASHEGGTFISIPKVSEKEGVVRVQTWVKNENLQKKTCTLQTTILDAANKSVQFLVSEAVINPGQLYKFDQTFKPVKNPHLWSTTDPYLYKIHSEVIDGKEIADACFTALGFRWYSWETKENALYLNGNKLTLKGENRHQEYPWLGGAVPVSITAMDFLDMTGNLKNNFLRTIHYPQDKNVYELADKYGIVAVEESPSVKNQDFSAGVHEQQIREMIRRDRNHPAIAFWSTGIESVPVADSKIILAEDSTRILKSAINPVDTIITFYGQIRKNIAPVAQAVKPGEPAKVVLTAPLKKIIADRGSVAIITVDIVDSKGIHVNGAANIIKWNMSGPASFIGPAVYESEIVKPDQSDGVFYTEMPVSNVIRSTGKAGRIHISVMAAGLASGSFDIDAEEILPDNSVLTEPVLLDDGRGTVDRIELNVKRLDEVPREIKLATNAFTFPSAVKQVYAKSIKDYILKNNTSLDTSAVEFRSLVDICSILLVNNGGQMIADDYNYNADHYNNCRLIGSYINATKLPPLFKEGLKVYYANSIIRQGSEKNAGEEMNWLNWIPSGGTVVIYQETTTAAPLKGVIYTKKSELPDLIAVVYPGFVTFSAEAKERALQFISKMNPYIHASSAGGKVSSGNNDVIANLTYSAEKGQPILIPLLKFISE